MASSSLILLTNPPSQDIGPDNDYLLSSDDPTVRSLSQSLKTHQEFLNSLVSDLVQDITSIVNSIPIPSVGGYVQSSGTSLTPNLTNAHTNEFTMTGDSNVNPPTGQSIAGDELTVIIVQDAVGGHALTWDPIYLFPGVFAPDPTALAASIYVFKVNAHQPTHLFLKSPPLIGVPWP